MAQQTSVSSLLDMTSSSNVVFLGEAGSGKSEIALNFAQALAELGGKPVHFWGICPPAQPGRHYGVLRDQPLPPLVGHPGAH